MGNTTASKAGRHTISVKNDDQVKGALQHAVRDLISLGLQTKQAHWNVRGPGFLAIHKQLDVITDAVHNHTDAAAERLASFGEPVIGSASDAAQGHLSELPDGLLKVDEAVDLIGERLDTVVKHLRGMVDQLEEIDPITTDLLVDITKDLEQQRFLFVSHLG